MKKQLLLLMCISTLAHVWAAPQFKKIEQIVIDAYTVHSKNELEHTYRARYIAATIGIISGIAGIYACYRCWPKVPSYTKIDASSQTGESGTNGDAQPKNKIPSTTSSSVEDPTSSWLGRAVKSCLSATKEGIINFAHVIPAASAIFLINTAGATVANKAMKFGEHYYRPLNWTWMLTEKTALYNHRQQLLHLAAILDGNTNQFEALGNNIKINWQTYISTDAHNRLQQMQPIVIANAQTNHQIAAQYIQLSELDELIKFQVIANSGAHLNQAARTALHAQFIQRWNLFVNALEQCLGYLNYKYRKASAESDIMCKQLHDTITEITAHTNTLAEQLSTIAHSEKSPGLFTQVYTYSKMLKDLCSALEINSIVM